MILGLDISTSTVGFTLMNLTGGVEMISYIKPKGKTMYEKVDTAFDAIDTKLSDSRFEDAVMSAIYAEAPNIMFRAGFSSAQVLSTILRFNGALLFTLSQKFNILIKEAMAISMRKQVIGKGRFAKGTDTKQEIFKWVKSQPDFPFNSHWPTIEKGKNKGKYAPEVYDMADSYIVAKYGLIHESRNYQNKN
jgi:hypothetical protein